MPADILIYALVAAGLVFWLRSVLGTRHGDERQRPNPFTSHNEAAMKAGAGHKPSVGALPAGGGSFEEMSQGLERHMGIQGATARDGLMEIAREDRNFSLPQFMQSAQEAFVMVVEAFADGDRETLRMLLSEPLYNAFDKALSARESENKVVSVEIHAVRRAEILDARVQKRMAYITVRFVSDETNIMRDTDGNVVAGNPDRVSETVDIWTFGRDLRSRSPAWLLYETRDEDARDSDHKTVPDSD